jgi:hypothetical protein
MSRIVKVSNGDYRLQVQSGGNIIFDTTGTIPTNTMGTVTIYGNLDVKGTTTQVETTNTTVTDNIIKLNSGETHTYITLGTAGIQIDRGDDAHTNSHKDALFVFDENVSHWDSIASVQKPGTWVLKTSDSSLSGLQLNTIVSSGSNNLSFDMQGGSGVLSIANSTNYANQVLNDNDIPNKKYINDYVTAVNGQAIVSSIYYPLIGPKDTQVDTTATSVNFTIGSTIEASISAGGLSVNNINIVTNTITNTSVNNLILTATNNNIEVNGVLNLDDQAVPPAGVTGATKIYSQAAAGAGKTGLYITNVNNSDELIAKNRALLFSMLF